MILLDTNVIIDIWRDDNDANINTLKNEEVCICGVVKSELIHGAVSEKNLEEISSRLRLPKQDWRMRSRVAWRKMDNLYF